MAFEAVLKKWGNSYAIIVPSEIVRERQWHENDKLLFEPVRIVDAQVLIKTVGLPKRKLSGQQFKDLARAGWR